MSEKNDILVQVDHLKKYFPVKGCERTGCTGGRRYFYLISNEERPLVW